MEIQKIFKECIKTCAIYIKSINISKLISFPQSLIKETIKFKTIFSQDITIFFFITDLYY